MDESSRDAGTIAVLIDRFEKQRLPRALSLKDKVSKGELLNDLDLAFLQQVLEAMREIQPLIARHPEHEKFVVNIANLYKEIVDKATENEKTSGGSA